MSIAGFVTRAEAGLVRPKSVSHNITASRGGVVVHYGGPPQKVQSHSDCLDRWRGWQRFHMGKSWVDIAYNMGVCDHGYVFAGRGVNVRSGANGTNSANQNYYAVAWIGGDGEQPTLAAIEAMEWAINACREEGNAGSQIRPHSDFRSTSCCGDPWREVIRNGMEPVNPPDPEPEPEPEPEPPPTPQPEPDNPIVAEMPLLKKGHSSLSVKRLQGLLVAVGHAPKYTIRADGTLDGVFGSGTEEAVEDFQRASGLSVDGIAGPNTWGALIGDMPLLRTGSRGTDVKRAQGLLVAHRFAPRNTIRRDGTLDGIFGSGTAGAVRMFQRASRIASDGIVGDNTWKALLTS